MATDRELLERHRPILRYHSEELYAAGAAEMMTDGFIDSGPGADRAPALKRRAPGARTLASTEPGAAEPLELAFLGATYGNNLKAAPRDFLDLAGSAYGADARELQLRYPTRVYGRAAARAGGGRWLQYWFFYYYNSKAVARLGLHEGDWEMIQIGLGADERPQAATYAQHNSGEAATWQEVERVGQAPVVYVARGAHASYFRSGPHDAPFVNDVCDGGGKEVRPALVHLDDGALPGWVGWPGRWGASTGAFASPQSPASQGKWKSPDRFHRDAARFVEPSEDAAPAVAPEPVVTYSRADGVTTVSFALPEGTTYAARLAIAVSPPGGAPVEYAYDVTAAPAARAAPRDAPPAN